MSLPFLAKYLFNVKRKTDSIHVTENNYPLPPQNKTKKPPKIRSKNNKKEN